MADRQQREAMFDDPEASPVCELVDAVGEWIWPRVQGFVAGAYFTLAAAWVWSRFL